VGVKKKMAEKINSRITMLFGLLILIVLMVALAPTMFSGINATAIPGAPTFFITILPLLIAVALIFVIWKFVSSEY